MGPRSPEADVGGVHSVREARVVLAMKRLLCLLIGCPLVRTGIGRWTEDFVWRHEYQCRRCLKRTWE